MTSKAPAKTSLALFEVALLYGFVSPDPCRLARQVKQFGS
jgi:hypothetical protein